MTTPASRVSDAVIANAPRQLLIGGEWRPAEDNAEFDVLDPATGEPLCAIANGSVADALSALDAAVAAQKSFAAMLPRERSDILYRVCDLLTERTEELALLMTLEAGKPVAESRAEIALAREFVHHFAEEAVRIEGTYQQNPNGGGRMIVMQQPVGPTLLVTPWNFPMSMGCRKIAPAIAAGCTVVVKPAGETPLTMLALAQIFIDAGAPAGVVNVVPTRASGAVTTALINSGAIRKVSFTGSTEVGRLLLAQAAEKVLKTSMELGGNAPFVVFEDADLDNALDAIMLTKMRNAGETCTAANRVFVHRSLVDRFAAGLAERMADLTIGHGTQDGVDIGPLISQRQRQRVADLVDEAVGAGAEVLIGGKAPDRAGFFYEPTVLKNVPLHAEIVREEIFGPVAPIIAFDTEEEAIQLANDTDYGLVSYIFTENLRRAVRVAEAMESGMVGLNQGSVSNAAAPFGGIKQSGLGREGGAEGIAEYLETKFLAVQL